MNSFSLPRGMILVILGCYIFHATKTLHNKPFSQFRYVPKKFFPFAYSNTFLSNVTKNIETCCKKGGMSNSKEHDNKKNRKQYYKGGGEGLFCLNFYNSISPQNLYIAEHRKNKFKNHDIKLCNNAHLLINLYL